MLVAAALPVLGAEPAGASQRPNPIVLPPNLRYAAMAYDAGSDRTVVFGGTILADLTASGYPSSNETWIFDLENATWTLKQPLVSPPARMKAAMAYDAESDRIILFGGDAFASSSDDSLTALGDFNDTWAYDMDSNTWTSMAPAAKPPARAFHAMAYVESTDRVVLFGGTAPLGSGVKLNDTWSYDFNGNYWREETPSAMPTALRRPQLAYDEASDRLVMFGGIGGTGASWNGSNETWLYAPQTSEWTRVALSGYPRARFGHGLVYDAASDRVILAGGEYRYDTGAGPSFLTFLYDTWTFDVEMAAWTRVDLNGTYTRSWDGVMAATGRDGRILLFGSGNPWVFDLNQSRWVLWRWPEPPFDLRVTSEFGRVDLYWRAPNGSFNLGLLQYTIYRGEDPDQLVPINNRVGGTSGTDTQLANGSTYFYAVAAVNDVGEGPPSEVVSTIAIAPVGRESTPPVPSRPFGSMGTLLTMLVFVGIAVSWSNSRGREALAATLFAPLFTRLRRDEVRNQVNRGRILQLVDDHPGMTFSQIGHRLQLSSGASAYHLRVLERSGEIRRVVQGVSARFYPPGYRVDPGALPPLSQVQRKILEIIVERREATFGQVATLLDSRDVHVTEKNIAYHLRTLVRKKGLVETRREAGRTLYSVDGGRRESLRGRLIEEAQADGAMDAMASKAQMEASAARELAAPVSASMDRPLPPSSGQPQGPQAEAGPSQGPSS
ncbi:MAG TPA: kelch repeat-containing protein [Candidatus Thermoplasmatota archaeon]|nr:kelch repeat-containing protein [Candidatus Thermoplasmatota archaeon]